MNVLTVHTIATEVEGKKKKKEWQTIEEGSFEKLGSLDWGVVLTTTVIAPVWFVGHGLSRGNNLSAWWSKTTCIQHFPRSWSAPNPAVTEPPAPAQGGPFF